MKVLCVFLHVDTHNRHSLHFLLLDSTSCSVICSFLAYLSMCLSSLLLPDYEGVVTLGDPYHACAWVIPKAQLTKVITPSWALDPLIEVGHSKVQLDKHIILNSGMTSVIQMCQIEKQMCQLTLPIPLWCTRANVAYYLLRVICSLLCVFPVSSVFLHPSLAFGMCMCVTMWAYGLLFPPQPAAHLWAVTEVWSFPTQCQIVPSIYRGAPYQPP